MQDTVEKAIEDRKIYSFDYKVGEFRQFFTTPFEQYSEHVGKPFQVVRRLPDAESVDDVPGEDMYLIRFEDGTEIESWGHECCELIYENCLSKG